MPSPTADPRQTGPLAISIRDLWMSYPSQRQGEFTHVLERVNLEVREGEFVCIVGPSGCGKTTLLNIIGGFLRASQGEVLVEGEPVAGPDRRRIFIVQEGGGSSPGSRSARTSVSAWTGFPGRHVTV